MQQPNDFVIGDFRFSEGETLLVDKPYEWTSFDVVNKIRRAITLKSGLKKFKVGHAGTLDPLATGLLILCTGRSTKEIESIQSLYKEYCGTIFLGATRPSHDKETEIDRHFSIEGISNEDIIKCASSFLGVQEQVPPVYSAIKMGGKRVYKHARSGKYVEMEPRKVEIHSFEITKIECPLIDFKVSCTKGTYIRSLAYDFGQRLNSGAYLESLRRTKIGEYSIEDASSVEQWIETIQTEEFHKY